jgi:GMP synthase-like glutamine amidotransferase
MEIGLVKMNPYKKPEAFIETLHTLNCRVHLLDATEMTQADLLNEINLSTVKKWIFTGSPVSIYEDNSPVVPIELLDTPKQFFLICYSMESVLKQLNYPVIKRAENKKENFILKHNLTVLAENANLSRNHHYFTPYMKNDIFIAEYDGEAMIAVYKNSIMTQFHPERSEDGKQMLFKWIYA